MADHRRDRIRRAVGGATALVRRALSARARPVPEGARRLLMALSVLLFVGAGVWAWTHRPQRDIAPNWWLLVLAFVLAVPALLLKAAEFSTAARILGQRPAPADAVEISVLSSAANLLPIPGSAIVTMRALSEAGSTYGQALTSTAAVSLTWVGATCIYGGGGVALAGGPLLLALALAAAGTALLAVAWRMIATQAGTRTPQLWLRAVIIETAFVLESTLRYWLILRGMGISASIAQAVSLTIAATLANAMAFFPGGLGIREVIAAGISPLVDLEAEAGLLMAVIDRIMWLSVLALAAGAVMVHRKRTARTASIVRTADAGPVLDDQPVMEA